MASVTGSKGHAWPPEEHQPRLRMYLRNLAVYEGEHEQVFTRHPFRFSYDRTRDYVSANMCGALTDLLASRSCGGGVTVSVTQDAPATAAWVQKTFAASGLEALVSQAAIDASVFGDAVLSARFDAGEGAVVVYPVNAADYYPETDPLDATRQIAATVATIIHAAENRAYLLMERNELRPDGYGWITNKLYRLTVSHLGSAATYSYDPEDDAVPLDSIEQTADLPEEQSTGITRLLSVRISNKRRSGQDFGRSDYVGLLGLQGELNNRLTQRAEVLDKHVDPLMYGPDISDERGRIALKEDKYIITDPGSDGAPVGMLVWDAQLAAVEAALAEIRELFAATAGVELSTLVPPTGGGPTSGRALRLSQTRTQATVTPKQMDIERAIAELAVVCVDLAIAQGVKPDDGSLVKLTPQDVSVSLGDGLPQDTAGEIEEQSAMLEVGVQSRVGAAMVLHGLDRDAAEALIAEIDAERDTASHSLGGLLSLNGVGTGTPTPPTMAPMPGGV